MGEGTTNEREINRKLNMTNWQDFLNGQDYSMSEISLCYKDVYINVLEYMEIMEITTIHEPRVRRLPA